MKTQTLLFDVAEKEEDKKYTSKISAPIYEPKHAKPNILLLCNDAKTKQLLKEIEESALPDDEKQFLQKAATRHSVFHYELIADYYSHASKEMQTFMEKSALVIIDFDQAIERGFVRLCEDIRGQYMEEYVNE